MSRTLELLRERLAATALGARGFTFDDRGDDVVGLSHEGADTGVRATVHLVRVPLLEALRAEGRWVEVTVAPSLLSETPWPVVLLAVDAAGHAVWATRDELLARMPATPKPDPNAEGWQVRYSAFDGVGGFALHRMILGLAREALRPALEGGGPGEARTRALLRRFVDEGEGFEAALAEVQALGVPGWFLAAHAAAAGEATLAFATPTYVEHLAIELRGAREALTVRGSALRCVRGGAKMSTWVNDQDSATVGVTLRLDHARTTMELRTALLAGTTSATALAAAARFVWRFGQGGYVGLAPGCAAAGVSVGSLFPARESEVVTAAVVETLDALAAIERITGRPFELEPERLADPAQAEALRELLLVWSGARIDRVAGGIRLTLTAFEVRRLLDASGFQRRITFRMPPARVNHSVLGVSVGLGSRIQEVTGTLVLSPGALARFVATLDPTESLDVELSAVEMREFYEPAAPAAPTTAAPEPRDAPSGSRSEST